MGADRKKRETTATERERKEEERKKRQAFTYLLSVSIGTVAPPPLENNVDQPTPLSIMAPTSIAPSSGPYGSIAAHMQRFCHELRLPPRLQELATHVGDEFLAKSISTRRNAGSVR